MEHFTWDAVEKVVMNEKISRRVITGDKVMVALIQLERGAVVSLHQHPCEQLSYIMEGALKFEVEGREVIVRKGQVLRVPPDIVHSAVALEDTLNFEVFSPPREDWLARPKP